MSATGSTVFSDIRASGQPSLALRDALAGEGCERGRVAADTAGRGAPEAVSDSGSEMGAAERRQGAVRSGHGARPDLSELQIRPPAAASPGCAPSSHRGVRFDSPQLYPKTTGQRPYFRDRPAVAPVRRPYRSDLEPVVSPSETDPLAVMRIARQLSRSVIEKYRLRATMSRRSTVMCRTFGRGLGLTISTDRRRCAPAAAS